MASGNNLLFITLNDGESITLEEGFLWLTIFPGTSASYTIQNSLSADIPAIGNKISSSITVPFATGPAPSISGWNDHTITASGGSVDIIYANGN